MSNSSSPVLIDLTQVALTRRSLHQEIVEVLRRLILEGRLSPGGKVPELDLCAQLGVSRTPLREALKVLAAEGLVVLLPNRGAVVTEVSVEETLAHFEVLEALESAVGQWAAQRATPEQMKRLEALHAELIREHQAADRARYFELNQAFHAQLCAAAHNPSLAATHQQYMRKISRARYAANSLRPRWDESPREHEDILDALRRRDGAAAAACMRAHIRATAEAVVAALRAIERRADSASFREAAHESV